MSEISRLPVLTRFGQRSGTVHKPLPRDPDSDVALVQARVKIDDTFLYVDAGTLGMLTARCIGEFNLKAGGRVWLSPDPARLHRFDKDGTAIRTRVESRAARARQTGTTRRCIWKNSN